MLHKQWHYSFRCGCRSLSVRARIADQFRIIASKIDGRYSVPIEMRSTPELSNAEHLECLTIGLVQAKHEFEERVQAKAGELLFQQTRPDLFAETEK